MKASEPWEGRTPKRGEEQLQEERSIGLLQHAASTPAGLVASGRVRRCRRPAGCVTRAVSPAVHLLHGVQLRFLLAVCRQSGAEG